MRKRLATLKSRFMRAALYFNKRHDATWPFTSTPSANAISVSTTTTPVSIDLGAAVAGGRLIYVNGTLIYTGHPGIRVGATALVTPDLNTAQHAGTVTWESPNLVFTPRPAIVSPSLARYTGPVAFSYTISDGKRRNTGSATGTVS